VISWSGSR